MKFRLGVKGCFVPQGGTRNDSTAIPFLKAERATFVAGLKYFVNLH